MIYRGLILGYGDSKNRVSEPSPQQGLSPKVGIWGSICVKIASLPTALMAHLKIGIRNEIYNLQYKLSELWLIKVKDN